MLNMEEAINHNKTALNILVYTDFEDADKLGMMKIIWPTMFRGTEQPNEFYPRQALEKLESKFIKEHPNPFEELKQVYKIGVSPEGMNFLEEPLTGSVIGLINKPEGITKSTLPLDYMQKRMDDFVFNTFEDGGMKLDARERSSELELYLEVKKETEKYENELTLNYRGWLAKKLGNKEREYVGWVGNLGRVIASDKLDCLRRNEVINVIPFVHYDKRNFDMYEHNLKAYLSLYEQYTHCKGHSVLISYGRLIAMQNDMNKIESIADKLRLYEGEYLKAKLDRETFIELAGK